MERDLELIKKMQRLSLNKLPELNFDYLSF